MRIAALSRLREKRRRSIALLALVVAFAGVALLIDRPKAGGLPWLGAPLIACGTGIIAWAMYPDRKATPSANSLASKAIQIITIQGQLGPFLPAFGVAIVVGDIIYNIVLSSTPALLTEDWIVLLGGLALVGYGFVPQRFAKERDFVFLFFVVLNGILVAPLLVARLYYQDFERSVDVYSWIALAPEAGAVLSIIGVSNSVHAVTGSTAPGLTFTPKQLGYPVTVVITTACSGIYSFGIFAAAFVAFVLTEYERPSPRLWVLLGLGFLTAYAANILRMVGIVLVGAYTDTAESDLQNMLVAHSYAGWLIFLGWIALFWTALLRFFPSTGAAGSVLSRFETKRHRCAVCGGALTPSRAAARCSCGSIYHRACIEATCRCPKCGRPPQENSARGPHAA